MAMLDVTQDMAGPLEAFGLFLSAGASVSMPFRFETPVRVWHGARLIGGALGAYSMVSPGAQLVDTQVGRYCSIGDGVQTLSDHPTDWFTTHLLSYAPNFPEPYAHRPVDGGFVSHASVKIGHDVWIGSRVSLRGGITIGDGAVIGAGAFVSKDVEPFTIVGGVPARPIRRRFSNALIERIQACPWWDWDLRQLALDWRNPEAAQTMFEAAVAEGRIERWAPGWRLFDFGMPEGEGRPVPLVFRPG